MTTYIDVTGLFCSTPAVFNVQVVALPPPVSASINTVICPGSTYLYTGASTSNNYYLKWTVIGGVPNQTSGNASSITWNNTGPWSISLTQVDVLPPSCASPPTVYTMSNTVKSPTITGNSITCFNKSEAYSTSALADTYQWVLVPSTLGSILPGTSPSNINIQFNNGTVSTPGVLNLQIIVCGQTLTTSYSITVNPPPTPTIVVPTNICQGQNATFSTPLTGGPYNWDFGDGTVVSGGATISHVYSNVAPAVVSLTVTNPGGCLGSAVTSTIINVKPTPVANVTSPNTLSQGCTHGVPFSYTLYASAQTISGTPVYSWTGPVSGSANTLITSQIGTYVMQVSINGCSNSTSVKIDTLCPATGTLCGFANTQHQDWFTYTKNCSTINFSPNLLGPGGAVSVWNFGDPGNSSSPLNSPSFTYPASGYYHVKLRAIFPATPSGNCFKDTTQTIAVPIYSAFKWNFGCGGPGAIVTSFIDQSNNLPTFPIASWSWVITGPSNNSSSSQNPSFTLLPGTYTAQLTIVGGGTSCITTHTLVVPQRPTAGFTVPSNVCANTPVNFIVTSTPSTSITRYLWTFGDGTGLITQNPSANGVRSYSFNAAPRSTSLTITDNFGCTSTFGPVGVTIKQNAFTINNVTVTPSSTVICVGDSTQLCFTNLANPNTNTPFTYLWNNFKTTSCIYAKLTGAYSVVAKDIYGCLSSTKTGKVNTVLVPTPLISGSQSYCMGQAPLLSIDKGTGYSYQWGYSSSSPGIAGSFTTSACTSPLFSPPNPPCTAMSPSVPATFTGNILMQGFITETGSGLNCKMAGPAVSITVHPLPTIPVITPTGQCKPSSPALLTASGAAGLSMLWNTGAQGSTITAINPGKYWASQVDQYGCKSIGDTVNIWPLPNFSSLLAGCYDICDTGSTVIPVPAGYALYTWLKGNTVVLGPSTSPINLTLTATSAGIYRLALKTVHGCVDTSQTITINVKPCASCHLSLKVKTFNCLTDSLIGGGVLDYNFQMSLLYGGTSTSNFSVSSPNGTLSVTAPTTGIISPGSNLFSGIFVPAVGATSMCLTFTVHVPGSSGPNCVWDTCLALVPCKFDSCHVFSNSLAVKCKDTTATGDPIYTYSLSMIYGGTATLVVSSSQGAVTQSSTLAISGTNIITGTFTDTPYYDGTLCLDVYLFTPAKGWCHEQVCAALPQSNVCYSIVTTCTDLAVFNTTLICGSVNSLGQRTYSMNFYVQNYDTSYYSYNVISAQGIVAGNSQGATIQPYSAQAPNCTFVQTQPLINGTVCFTLVATNVYTGQQCATAFCFTPTCSGPRLMSPEVMISLYPNPTGDYTIAEYTAPQEMPCDRLSIIDLNGRVVQQEPLKELSGSIRINTSSLVPGLYFIRVMNQDKAVLVKKLIIQR